MSMQDHPAGSMPGGAVQPEMNTLPIYEVARELGLAQHVMRMWEARFPQLRPLCGPGGRRAYRAHDIAVLRQIANLLYVQKLSLAQAQAELARSQLANSTLSAPALEVATPPVEDGVLHDPALSAGVLPPASQQEAPAAPPHIEAPVTSDPMLVVEQVTTVTEVTEVTEIVAPPVAVAVEDEPPAADMPADAVSPAAAQAAESDGVETPQTQTEAAPPAAAVPVQAEAQAAGSEDGELPLEQLVMIELERLQAENAVLRDSLRGVLVELQALREMVPV